MGMNPETNKFEMLANGIGDTAGQLFRPNGEPVPGHWPVFHDGELVVVKDYSFRVAHIGESHLLLEPVGVVDLSPKEKHEAILLNNPKRKHR